MAVSGLQNISLKTKDVSSVTKLIYNGITFAKTG
jgi:hypothetical protein